MDRGRIGGHCAVWAVAALAACSSDGEGPATGGLEVAVRYDSTMPVETIAVAAVGPDGAEVWARSEHPAPLFLDPPGVREAVLRFDRPSVASLTIVVDGLAGEPAQVVGSGQADVEPQTVERVVVRLGVPVVCGDGQRAGREACDDANVESDDGCSMHCTIEAGYTCEGRPSVCHRCGDGEVGGTELCDDGNLTDGDGCSSTCTPEAPAQPYLLEAESLALRSTMSPEWAPVPGARLSLPAAADGERWVVFASGAFGSSSEAEVAAKVGLQIGGELVDDFGHQTMGEVDNAAGFVTFSVIEDPSPTEAQLVFAAEEGETRIRDVRVVAMRVPAQAALEHVRVEDGLELEGLEEALATLEVAVPNVGEYLVLAKANLTESPGADTARVWLDTPEGPTPLDDRGVTFSSPRDARVPFFAARPMRLESGRARFTLKGRSSGSGSLDGWHDGAFRFRRRVTVTAGEVAVPSGYVVAVTFDHRAMVEAGRARADGQDLHVLSGDPDQPRRVPRVVDPDRGWNKEDTTVWLALPRGLDPNQTAADLWLYFGADAFEPAPSDPADVFVFYDDFARGASPEWQELQGSLRVEGGKLVVAPGTSLSAPLPSLANQPLMLEARLAFDAEPAGPTAYLGLGGADGDAGWGGAGFSVRDGQHYFGIARNFQAYEPVDPTAFRLYALALQGQTLAVFWEEGQEIGRVQMPQVGFNNSGVGMQNGGQSELRYDWVRVRPFLEPAPSVSVEPTVGAAGLRPSRFDGMRILVMRLDGFAGRYTAVSDERVRTTDSATVTLTRLEVPAPAQAREHLVVLSARVAGDSNGERRRSGLCLADGEALLRTAHKINRDATDPTGYHHVAGVIDARTTDAPAVYETAIRSPDGLGVEGAAAAAAVIRF